MNYVNRINVNRRCMIIIQICFCRFIWSPHLSWGAWRRRTLSWGAWRRRTHLSLGAWRWRTPSCASSRHPRRYPRRCSTAPRTQSWWWTTCTSHQVPQSGQHSNKIDFLHLRGKYSYKNSRLRNYFCCCCPKKKVKFIWFVTWNRIDKLQSITWTSKASRKKCIF